MAKNKYICFGMVLLISTTLAVLPACNTVRNPCLEPKVSKLNVACYQYKTDSKTYIDTALPNANFVCLDIDSANRWYWGAKAQSKYEL
ncbi:MAG: hypothetical protein IT256_03180, partial [Chitinophagaceae bacterium]|nr:hypothetical protein [Chitinophagaceae bacterium]